MPRILLIILSLWVSLALQAQVQVDPALRKYFDIFLIEAKIKNIIIDTTKLKVLGFPGTEDFKIINQIYKAQFKEHPTLDTCWVGITATKKDNGDKYIYFNAGNFFNQPELEREIIVFHELGHALMNTPNVYDGFGIESCSGNKKLIYDLYRQYRKEVLNQFFKYAKHK